MTRESVPSPEAASALAVEVCHRQRGIGADGLVYLTEPLGMVIYNSDGSPAVMCGNALRCLGAQASALGLLEVGLLTAFATPSGPRSLRVVSVRPWVVEVDMGLAERLPGPDLRFAVGNPHHVIIVDRLPDDWQAQGAAIERATPGGINVEFVQVLAPGRLRVHVWERGAGATLACGSGACAVVAAVGAKGLVTVELPGGELHVEQKEDGHLWMRGPARELYEGIWRPDPL